MAANATERGVRGQNKSPKLDGVYRAQLRSESRTLERALKPSPTNCLGATCGSSRAGQNSSQREERWHAGGGQSATFLPRTNKQSSRRKSSDSSVICRPPTSDREQSAERLRSHIRESRSSRLLKSYLPAVISPSRSLQVVDSPLSYWSKEPEICVQKTLFNTLLGITPPCGDFETAIQAGPMGLATSAATATPSEISALGRHLVGDAPATGATRQNAAVPQQSRSTFRAALGRRA